MSAIDKKPECPTCGATMAQYRHVLNKNLIKALLRLYRKGGGPLNVNEALGMTHNQAANWQKLRYWDLVRKAERPDGTHKGGYWVLTHLGKLFCENRAAVAKWAWTFRGEVQSYDGPELYVSSIVDGYEYRPEYAENRRPLEEVQRPLFDQSQG